MLMYSSITKFCRNFYTKLFSCICQKLDAVHVAVSYNQIPAFLVSLAIHTCTVPSGDSKSSDRYVDSTTLIYQFVINSRLLMHS